MKIKILGNEWTIEIKRKKDDAEFQNETAVGWTDYSSRTIALIDKRDLELEDNEAYQKKVLRHELIHAFLMESGLYEHCDWHCEEMVDWFAFQAPKIFKTFDKLKLL